MSNLKRAAPAKPAPAIGWAGVRTEQLGAGRFPIFAQGDPADSVMYVDAGAVLLSVLSHSGKKR
jgi:CRP-like cAMP-binding protein